MFELVSASVLLLFLFLFWGGKDNRAISIMEEKEKLENSEIYIKNKAEEKTLKFYCPR